MATDEDGVQRTEFERIVDELRRLKAATDADRAVLRQIVCRHDRAIEKGRLAVNALIEHDNDRHAAMVAVLDACHLLADRVALLQAKIDLLTDVDDRRVH
jgi:hypothetical protein